MTYINKAALIAAVSAGLMACDALQITGGPPAVGAAQASNLLDHGNFSGGFGAWRACSDPSLVSLSTNDANTEGTAVLQAGGCLYQTVPAMANDNMVLNCNARKASDNWASFTFGYLDEDYQPLKTVETEIPEQDFTNLSATLRAPANTAYVEVLVYAQDGAVVEACELVNTQQGLPDELLVNSYFEEELSGWETCSNGTVTVANNIATVNNSCISQKFTASEGMDLRLTCVGTKTGDEHAAVALGYLDENSQAIGMTEAPVGTEEGFYPTVELSAPPGTSFAQVMVYTEGAVDLSRCTLQSPASDNSEL